MTSFTDWQAPIPLGALERRSFPSGVFPEIIDDFVSGLSKSIEVPLDLPALAVISGIATAAHKKYIIEIKSGYFEPLCIWTAVALPPGCRKSAVQHAVIKPIIDYEMKRQVELKPIIAEKISNNKSLELRIKEMRNKAARAKQEDFPSLQKEIEYFEKQLEKIPVLPQYWTADITPENLATLMAANSGCMSILSDEAGIFDTLAGRYSSGIPNLDLFLKSHTGTPARINRVGRPPDLIERPILTLGLCPQPEILKGLGKNMVFRGRGLLGRFLYGLPYSNLGKRELDAEEMSSEITNAYHGVIHAILSKTIDNDVLHVLTLSKEAYEIWHQYSRVIEIKMDEGGPLAALTDWGGKLPGQIARLAALLHVARHAFNKPEKVEVTEMDMKRAIMIGGYLTEHAIAVFDLMGAEPSLDKARVILYWIKKNRLSKFSFRDCHYANKSRFKKAKDVEVGIEVLVENYFIHERESEKKPYRPSRVFDVNPLVYQSEG